MPPESDAHIIERKQEHIAICADQDVESERRFTGLDSYHFLPCAVPELGWGDLSCEVQFLGRSFSAPLLITGMTGGVAQGQEINRRLAAAAQDFRLPMGVGSQRIALEHPRHAAIFSVKDKSPSTFVIGNLGLSELAKAGSLDQCKRAVAMISADAMAIHLNVLQECVQGRGSREFRGFWPQLSQLCSRLEVPVVVKEVGCGISPPVARRLFDCGVAAIDCAGRGGTSWSYVEALRSKDKESARLGETYRDWGIPTAYNIAALAREFPGQTLIASGGMRSGLDVAKAVALGATTVGFGLPLLRAALKSEQELHQYLATLIRELKVAMLCTGCSRLSGLSAQLVTGIPYAPSV